MRKKKKKKKNWRGEASTHWESTARLRLPCDPDPPSMSAAGKGLWAQRCWDPLSGQGVDRARGGAMLSVAEMQCAGCSRALPLC